MNLIEDSYYEIIKANALSHPDCEAVVMGKIRLTYQDLLEKIDLTAYKLLKLGMKEGDKVVLWAKASPAWLYTYYGIIHAGGIAVVLNANLATNDIVPLSDFAEATFMFYGANKEYKGTLDEAEKVAERFHIDKKHVLGLTDISYSDCSPLEVFKRDVKDDAYIIYTSGTTSFPKAVLTSQFGIINTVDNLKKAISSALGKRCVMAVPLFHAYGLMVSWAYLSSGGTILIPENIKAECIADLIAEEKASDLWSVAVIYQRIVDNKELTAKVEPYINLCTIAGSYTTPVQFIRYETALDNAVFLNMYGMTETCAAYCLTRPEDDVRVRYETVGRPIDGVEIKIWNEDNSSQPIGEIVTRGYHLKNSYYKLPEEAQAVDEEGWLHSGDLGYIDERGNLHIAGRSKDLIIKGGENVAPAEIEAAVLECECIRECRVFGYHDQVYGENIGACIVLDKEKIYDEEAVREHVKKAVGPYKTPAYFLIFNKFPLNDNGKINQRELHTSMLVMLRRMEISGELENGLRVMAMTFRNGTYCSSPIAVMLEKFAASLGMTDKKAANVGLVAEEVMTLRVNEKDRDMGNIYMELIAYRDRLRVTFVDLGIKNDNMPKTKDEINIPLSIISHLVDNFDMRLMPDGHFKSISEFIYDRDFSIQDFLMQHEIIE